MDTKYVVFSGPHYPPAVKIESTADSCLVAQAGCTMEVLLAFTVPLRPKKPYSERTLITKKSEGKKVLEGYAKTLNRKRASTEAKETLLKELKEKRLVQLNVVKALTRAKRAAQRPVNFSADFGNLLAGEREGSFSRRGTVDGLW